MAHALFSFPTHFLASPRAHAASRPSFVASAGAAAAAASPASLYEVLGVPANATNCEIKASYRRLALECHPDVGAPAEEFLRLHAAYATLADPDKRADYDRQRMAPDQHLLRRRVQLLYLVSTREPIEKADSDATVVIGIAKTSHVIVQRLGIDDFDSSNAPKHSNLDNMQIQVLALPNKDPIEIFQHL
ncbi:hypothetical protein ZIOFF_010423 [Zingiber officinale]|uniref:J domain-containing protein n=1 Tax=Zingiber officinale TaxID=94328 RepID=A0A8J5LYB1_ZINOF|nr:hypothetical protein ZIOFF_010423 [Zingiber officinale]